MPATNDVDLSQVLTAGETPQYSTRWSKWMLVGWNLLALPPCLLGLLFITNPELRSTGIACLIVAFFISGGALLVWQKRLVVVTNQRVIYLAGHSEAVRAMPLDRIDRVKQGLGTVELRAGSIFNTMRMMVPNAAALANAIEGARAGVLVNPKGEAGTAFAPQAAGKVAGKGRQRKPMTRSQVVVGSAFWVLVAVGIISYNLPVPKFGSEAPNTEASVPKASTNEPPVITPVETRVEETIITSALMDCWMNSIREAHGWIFDGDRTGDQLARLYGKGGIAVKIVVIGNRIDLQKLDLAGVTGKGTPALKEGAMGGPGEISYWDAQDIYSSAVRAITRCGIADVPLPNGTFQFIFDPNLEDIPVIRVGD